MSALGTGDKPCRPDGNGCLCGICKYRKAGFENSPKECRGGGCIDCDPDRTEPDTDTEFGPVLDCSCFEVSKEYESYC